ncbi:HelD family protein [Blautia massiliensis (ex Durand et al. 2017)]|uniref:HelD family protein n=1 Tax=Blautia massiliensis (ex Durand et al. 2017) TaxID=1737424 RepID=UPI001570D06E|nr:UvrD-helicase domain-containing protein [Blautia massiliensis (ex Durand et al. 2017)]NSG49613.1 AAA family ATPase [Blautia massiliensis (ex Durand et al. 2017)]NSL01419.1 AAA family ATPase [Blautia massiliensis (ex Durand et al. 2017)]
MAAVKNGREYLSHVTESLKHRIVQLDESIEAGQKEIEGMHEYYWENYTEMDQYGYENFDNQQALLHEINASNEKIELRRRFRKMMDSPFFGRVDFCYEGEDEPEIFYIGIANLAEENGGLPLIYDWRAPVSGLFYDFDKGPASYLAPLGEIHGDIAAKWQYKIRGGKMIYEFESDVKIDDEILKAELGSNGDVQLKNIIRTIQKEQNAIIRNTSDRIMVIQGAAGSGKTSIALHRIAYLLYHDRKNLKSSSVLVLSPNGVFSDYISHILPELGEENIREMSFDLFAYKRLKNVVSDCEDRYDLIERQIAGLCDEKLLKEKLSRDFLDRMEGYLVELEDSLMNFRDVEHRGVVKKEQEIIELFYFKFMDIPLLSRMDAVAEYFIDEVETLKGFDLPDEEREAVKSRFYRMYETRDLYVLYNRFLRQEGFPSLPQVQYEKRKLRYEDVYPVLYLKYRLETQQEDSGVRHLIVDEMQDYSMIQYLIIQRLFKCRMTILGDREQTMDGEQQDVLTFLPKIFGKDIRRIVMNKSYRNTVEIASYANKLAGITEVELFERHGKPVVEKEFPGLEEALESVVRELRLEKQAVIAENADEGVEDIISYETAAVIARTADEARETYYILKEKLEAEGFDTKERLSLLHRDSTNFQKGLTVTTFYMAKGLEFDQVFSVFPGEDRSPIVERARYIAATRALHELYMYEVVK